MANKYLGSEALTSLVGKIKGGLDEKAPNRNLLDNWYFGNPVNQRNKTTYEPAGSRAYVYHVDRWLTNIRDGETVTLTADGLVLQGDDCIEQRLELKQIMPGAQYTISVLYADNTLGSGTGIFPAGADSARTKLDCGDNIRFSLHTSTASHAVRIWMTGVDTPPAIVACKLELGDKQTLAHKEGETWVLNDLPDYSAELAKCQRYQLNLFNPAITGQSYVFQGIASSAAAIYGLCPTPVTMAKLPTLSSDCTIDTPYLCFGELSTGYNGATNITGISVYTKTEHGVIIQAIGQGFVQGNSYVIYVKDTPSHYCMLDANL